MAATSRQDVRSVVSAWPRGQEVKTAGGTTLLCSTGPAAADAQQRPVRQREETSGPEGDCDQSSTVLEARRGSRSRRSQAPQREKEVDDVSVQRPAAAPCARFSGLGGCNSSVSCSRLITPNTLVVLSLAACLLGRRLAPGPELRERMSCKAAIPLQAARLPDFLQRQIRLSVGCLYLSVPPSLYMASLADRSLLATFLLHT